MPSFKTAFRRGSTKNTNRHGSLVLSVGRQLFQGATNSGLVSVNDLPLSMLVLGGTVALLETPSHSGHPGTRPSVEEGGTALLRPPRIAGRDSGVEGATAGAPRAKDIEQPSAGEAVAAKSPETDTVANAINVDAPDLNLRQ